MYTGVFLSLNRYFKQSEVSPDPEPLHIELFFINVDDHLDHHIPILVSALACTRQRLMDIFKAVEAMCDHLPYVRHHRIRLALLHDVDCFGVAVCVTPDCNDIHFTSTCTRDWKQMIGSTHADQHRFASCLCSL